MEFDVVVVGGGTAGCVVASRLAQADSRSVALIEAGPDMRSDPPPDLHVAWDFPRRFEWGFESEPDERGTIANIRRGKLLGGTSWVTRFAVRGSPHDYDEWARLGNPGWGFDDVLPYFNRLESDADFGDRPWHGDRGPVPVDRYLDHPLSDVTSAALDAMKASGFADVVDHNAPGAVGAGRMPMNSRDGIRVSTADAYLPLDIGRSNLTCRADTQVDRILVEREIATGVRLVDGTSIRSNWIVLAAGVYGSPAILMRSGIGPADDLRALGIEVAVDLPGVGANLADHPAVTSFEAGYAGSPRGSPILHVIATFASASPPSSGAPDLVLWTWDPVDDPPTFSIETMLMKPMARGKVRLRSAAPMDLPLIALPGLESADVDRLAEGHARATAIAREPGIKDRCEEPGSTTFPPAEVREWVRATRYSVPHVVGTCSMGRSPEEGAVVDESGRVHGIERLSVIDASIIPEPPSGFPHIPTIMIAERLSEWLGRNM